MSGKPRKDYTPLSVQAAVMRENGSPYDEICARFGWDVRTARDMVYRGKIYDQFKVHHAAAERRRRPIRNSA